MKIKKNQLRRIIRESILLEWYKDVGKGDDSDPHGVDDIILWSALPKNVKILYSTRDPKEEAILGVCSTHQCAQFVSNMLNQWQGNAWFAHSRAKKSVFNKHIKSKAWRNLLAFWFSELNKKGGPDSSDSDIIKGVLYPMIPTSTPYSNSDFKLGDVVGLWFEPSSWHAKAFFQAATGNTGAGYTTSGGSGPYFVRSDNGKPWDPSMLGKDIKFKPGRTMRGGKTFGMNTHLGFVGGIRNGEPIIFHNIHGAVYATPLSAMSPNDNMVVWKK